MGITCKMTGMKSVLRKVTDMQLKEKAAKVKTKKKDDKKENK